MSILYHPWTRRAIGALGVAIVTVYALGIGARAERLHPVERIAGVAIELGADIQDMGTPELAHYISGLAAAQAECESVTNARRMGGGVRIACDQGAHVYFLHSVNGVLFVSDITDSGR